MKKFFALIAVLIATTAAWAQTSVSTDSELRTAIQTNGAIITVTSDIDLSNDAFMGAKIRTFSELTINTPFPRLFLCEEGRPRVIRCI